MVVTGRKVGQMYILNDTEKKCMIANEKNEFELWHKRLGHVSEKRLLNMSNNDLVHGLPKFNRVQSSQGR